MPEREFYRRGIVRFNTPRKIAEFRIPSQVGVENSIDSITKTQLAFSSNDLPTNRVNDVEVETYEYQDTQYTNYDRTRNYRGMNVDYAIASLQMKSLDLAERVTHPLAVSQSIRRIIPASGNIPAGYTSYEYDLQCSGKSVKRLKDSIAILNMQPDFSTLVANVAIDRFVIDGIGEVTESYINLHDKKIAKELGIEVSAESPFFFDFTPEFVLITTSGNPNVLGLLSYDYLAQYGIKANFTDNPEEATLKLAAGNLSMFLVLGKKVKPKYVETLFSPEEQLITRSRIDVQAFSEAALN